MEHQRILQNIRDSALNFLGMRNHSAHELRTKLLKKFKKENEEVIEKILSECLELGLLNDTHFAAEFVRYRLNTAPRGKFALRTELHRKGIESEIIDQVLSEISEEDEYALAKKLAEQKLRTFPENLEKKKQKEKLFRFLSSRGIRQEVIFRVMQEMN